LLVFLCLEVAKDTAQGNFLPLVKLCDVAQLLKTYSDTDWDGLSNSARRLGAQGPLSLALRTVEAFFDISRSVNFPKNIASDTALDGLGRAVIRRILESPHPKPKHFSMLSYIKDHWFIVLTRDNISGKALTIIYATGYFMKRLLCPSEDDAALFSLPKHMRFMYYIVRPVRLVIKYAMIMFRRSRF
jgi:hypothetical protein